MSSEVGFSPEAPGMPVGASLLSAFAGFVRRVFALQSGFYALAIPGADFVACAGFAYWRSA